MSYKTGIYEGDSARYEGETKLSNAMIPINWTKMQPRSYSKPTVVCVDFDYPVGIKYCLAGCAYGYLYTTSGDIKTWNSYSGAWRVKKLYKDQSYIAPMAS